MSKIWYSSLYTTHINNQRHNYHRLARFLLSYATLNLSFYFFQDINHINSLIEASWLKSWSRHFVYDIFSYLIKLHAQIICMISIHVHFNVRTLRIKYNTTYECRMLCYIIFWRWLCVSVAVPAQGTKVYTSVTSFGNTKNCIIQILISNHEC